MTQKDRIQYYCNYIKHPLRKEYESKKHKIKKKKKYDYYDIFKLVFLHIPFVFFVLYGIWFFDSQIELVGEGISDDLFCIICGLINLGICYFALIKLMDDDFGKESDERQKLIDEYLEKDLYEVKRSDFFKCKCGEYEYVPKYGDECYTCSVDSHILSYEERSWCAQQGKCMHCSIFAKKILSANGVDNVYGISRDELERVWRCRIER